jgi:hypothetical protein
VDVVLLLGLLVSSLQRSLLECFPSDFHELKLNLLSLSRRKSAPVKDALLFIS